MVIEVTGAMPDEVLTDEIHPPKRGARLVDLRDLRFAADLRGLRVEAVRDAVKYRARALPMQDRAALEAAVFFGHNATRIAAVMGRPARSVRTHLRRLLRRVLAAEFACVQSLGHRWPPSRRQVGEAIFVRGHSMRAAASSLGFPLHAVRRHADAIRVIAQTSPPRAWR
ncbi:MAG: hypothetical protein JNK25_07730 [Phycisphaerae bacterium]|nr:hypothetical protein [Phycisphaerae bacterium]